MSSSQRAYATTPTAVTIPQNVHKYITIKQRTNLAASPKRASIESSNIKSFINSEQTNSNGGGSYKQRKLNQGCPVSVKLKPELTKKKTMGTVSRQIPKLYDLSKPDYTSFNRNTDLIRQEIVKDRLLYRELAARLAEAKLSLVGLDSSEDKPSTDVTETEKHDTGVKRPGRVSFLSVSRRVASIIRFRQAAQPRNHGTPLEKERSSLETNTLPKTPRFSSYMSPAAQYALMKGYEDIIFEKLSSKFPECTGMLKRNKTPHHSIAISDKANFAASELKSLNYEPNSLEDEDRGNPENPLNCEKMYSEFKDNGTEIASAQHRYFPDALPELKGQLYASKKLNSEETNELIKDVTTSSESLAKATFHQSSLQNTNKLSSFSTNLVNGEEKMKNLLKYGIQDTSYQSLQELAGLTSGQPLGRNRRIHMSYRIENAMDILDTMKTKSEQALSPRVRIQSRRHIAPLHDFNRWTDQWANEFNQDVV